MSQSLLHTIARKAETLTPDADLLARFTRDRDQSAFEELVKRHGPLVWAACRHLLPDHADAEDAFQAVFLALVRSGGSIRDGRALPAWLHGVAVRIATRAKRAFARRRARERAAALPEADRPVSDGAWDALVAAAHEEVQRLPEAERTAFVLCDLQGVPQSVAAARLGWPIGSLSGRLCKARQRLLDRLAARAIAPAVAVGMGLTAGGASALPDRLFAVVKVFPGAPGAASAVARGLARGLTEGLTMRVKVMATAAVLVAAVGLTGGAALLSQADAQPPSVVKEVKELTEALDAQDPTKGGTGGPPGKGGPGGRPGASGMPGAPGMSGWGAVGAPGVEYKFVDTGSDRAEFKKTITQNGKEGWEFCGSERFGPDALVLVFKKVKPHAVMGGFGGGIGGGGAGVRGRDTPIEVEIEPGPAAGAVPRPEPDAAATAFRALDANGDGKLSLDEMPEQLKKTFRLYTDGREDAVRLAGFRKYYQAALVGPEREGAGETGVGGRPGAPAKPNQVTIFTLKHATAAELVTVLKKLYPNLDMTADPRTNTLLVRGDESALGELKALVTRLDNIESAKPK